MTAPVGPVRREGPPPRGLRARARFLLGSARLAARRRLERLALGRRGVRIDASAFVRNVSFDGPAVVEAHCRLWGLPRLRVGRNVRIHAHAHLQGEIVLEDDVVVGPRVVIWWRDHAMEPGTPIRAQGHRVAPIHVGRGAQIGAGAIVLRGVRIGAGAVVGAGAVCTRDVPEGSVVLGSPARLAGTAAE